MQGIALSQGNFVSRGGGLAWRHPIPFDPVLTLQRYSVPHGHVAQACELAEIREFVEKLPTGCDTELGEPSVDLSGGHKQRFANGETENASGVAA